MTFLLSVCSTHTLSSPADSAGPMSTAHSHPPHLGGMVGHPSVISTSRPLPSPMVTLGSPMNGLASPYPVITSSLGSPSVSLPSTPNMNFGQLSSPQVRSASTCGRLDDRPLPTELQYLTIDSTLGKNGLITVAFKVHENRNGISRRVIKMILSCRYL